jgi:outer membrane protein assembly factor BamA
MNVNTCHAAKVISTGYFALNFKLFSRAVCRVAILFCLFLLQISFAQSQLKLEAYFLHSPPSFQPDHCLNKTYCKDSSQAWKAVKICLQKLRRNGFLAASLDSFYCSNTVCKAQIYVGEKWSGLRLISSTIEPIFLTGVRKKLQRKRQLFTPEELAWIQQKILSNAENKGYPFAEVYLDSITTVEPSANLKIEKHELFLFDTLETIERVRIKKKFLSAYLGIKQKKPYDESKVNAAEQRLNALPFAEVVQPHTVLFDKERARLRLHLKDRKASMFNFFMGVLPGAANRKVLITGEAKLNLYSVLGFGEQLNLEWNKTLPKTQVLKTMLAVPYLLGLPIGVDLRFELFKRDTSWLDLDRDFGIRYQFAGMNYLKASLKQKSTIVLSVDTAFIKINKTLPAALDIRTNEFALEYYFMNLNYRFNPTSGWQITAGGSAGAKTVKRNSIINNLMDENRGETFSYLYDSIGKNSFQSSLWISVDKFWKVHQRMTLLTSFKGRWFYSRLIFENEMYRIGGMNTLRGFTEESIITPYYGIANVEYRYLLSKNAFFFLFFNAAIAQRFQTTQQDFPFGFGTGVSLETKVGIFGITYALGQKQDERLNVRNSKIHFGYINYF